MKSLNLKIMISCLLTLISLNIDLSWASNPFDELKISREQAGKLMPPFALKTIKGTLIRSESLRGKVLLLNFWATWCGPCKEEMPSLARLQERFQDQDFALLTITTDLQRKAIQSFLHMLHVDFPVLLDETQDVSRTYMARALPLSVLIGKDGKIIGRAMGPRDWDSPLIMDLMRQELGRPIP